MPDLTTTRLWLRRVVPDLFLAAVVALLVTVAAHHLEGAESRRIGTGLRTSAQGGLTLDEHVDVLTGSMRRSTLLHLPLLAAGGGATVGIACRRRRWAWLTAIGAVLPTLLWVAALQIDRPVTAGILAGIYSVTAVMAAATAGAVRSRWAPSKSGLDTSERPLDRHDG